METNRLRQLCVIVETGGMREAARLLHISHGGLSKSMKTLEQELRSPLFLPSGRGVVLTDVGRRLYTSAKRVLAQVEELESVARGEESTTIPFRIATFEMFSTYFMGELIEKALGGRRVMVREAVPGAIEDAIANDEADLGVTFIPVPRVELEYLEVTKLEMAIFGRLDKFDGIPTPELPFCAPVTTVRGSALVGRSLDGWPDEKCSRTVTYAVDTMETALELARRGLGVVYMPTFMAMLHNRMVKAVHVLERLPLPRAIANAKDRSWTVSLVKRRSTEEATLAKRIARVLRDVCGATGGSRVARSVRDP